MKGNVDPTTTPPSGTVTFLFTDIVGSTRMVTALGDRYGSLLEQHREMVFGAVDAHGGHRMGTEGDACFAVFARATDAAAAAIEAQRALDAHAWPDGARITVRMGLHTGESSYTSGGYIGLAVHKVARITSVAHAGQILMSAATANLLAGALPEGVSLRDLGAHRLKDLGQPEQLFHVVAPGLADEFPPPCTLEASPHNLPIQLTSFVGREAEIAEVSSLLGTARLVSLLGPGGAGKTRLALHVAADAIERFPDGAWFVDLSNARDGAAVEEALAAVLGLRAQAPPAAGAFGASPRDSSLLGSAVEHLRKGTALIVLDNCEQALEACAGVAARILTACPNVSMLATSREPLDVPGEVHWRIPPLGVDASGDASSSESVRLFAERAALHRAGFTLSPDVAPAVEEICRRLEGMPLAIELAAAWVGTLTPPQILARLDDRFRLLTRGSSVLPSRQRTLRDAVDWSYDLLVAEERALLCRLVVFAGSFTLEAVEAVAAGDGIDSMEVLHLLSRLVDKSLVVHDATSERYRLLETIRQYALDRLLGDMPAPPRAAPAPADPAANQTGRPQHASLRREGEYWTLESPEGVARFKHSKGLLYLGELLRASGVERHVLDLAGGAGMPDEAARAALRAEAPIEILDDRARASYRARIRDLEVEIAEAREWNDEGRAARALDELEALTAALTSGTGLGGRARTDGGAAERARMSVGKALRGTIAKIEEALPTLGGHLRAAVVTGLYCAYRPDPTSPLTWDVAL